MSSYKCNLVIAGVGKSGTSSLHTYLDAHPEICMSSTKEPQFFSINSRWEMGSAIHNNLFSCAKPQATVFGESSTTYFATEIALKRIKESLKSPRIIIVLRDPIERVISHYRWMFALGLETRPFLQAISESGYGFDPNVSIRGNYMSYLEFSLYSKWVPKWQEAFGIDNVLILRTDDLKDRPISVVSNCCSFLGIRDFNLNLPEAQNKTEDVISRTENRVSELIRTYLPFSVRRSLKAFAPALVKIWNGFFIKSRKISPPTITDEEKAIVTNILNNELTYFSLAPHVARLQPLIEVNK